MVRKEREPQCEAFNGFEREAAESGVVLRKCVNKKKRRKNCNCVLKYKYEISKRNIGRIEDS